MNKDTQKNLLRLASESYDKIASDYDRTRKKEHTPLFDKLKEVCDKITDGQKVMDVGCGNGRLFANFKDKKIYYLGVDKSAALIELAKRNHPGARFITGDILELSKIPDINFDYVFCAAVLHHLPGHYLRLGALKQLKNKIVENGKIMVTVWNMWRQPKFVKHLINYSLLKFIGKNKMDFGDLIFDWKNGSGQAIGRRYYHALRKRELKRLAKEAGLRIVKLWKDKYNYYIILSK